MLYFSFDSSQNDDISYFPFIFQLKIFIIIVVIVVEVVVVVVILFAKINGYFIKRRNNAVQFWKYQHTYTSEKEPILFFISQELLCCTHKHTSPLLLQWKRQTHKKGQRFLGSLSLFCTKCICWFSIIWPFWVPSMELSQTKKDIHI